MTWLAGLRPRQSRMRDERTGRDEEWKWERECAPGSLSFRYHTQRARPPLVPNECDSADSPTHVESQSRAQYSL